MNQRRRLRQMAQEALKAYDLNVKQLRLITNGWNCIFRLDTQDGQKYVLRITYPGLYTAEEVHSEMIFLAALQRDTAFAMSEPLRTESGDLMTTVQVPGIPEPRHCVIFSWVPGKDLAEEMTPENYAKLGYLTAQLHEFSTTFTPPPNFTITTANTIFNPKDKPVLLNDEHRHLMTDEERKIYQNAVDRVEEAVGKLFANKSGLRVLHYDLHAWNIKLYRGQITPIDFEDLTWGYPVQDIGLTFYYLIDRPDYQALCDGYKTGYSKHSPWPEAYPGEVEIFAIRRALDLVNFVVGSDDPEEQAEAPEFVKLIAGRIQKLLSK